MAQPEMSYAPAYYQDSGQLFPAYQAAPAVPAAYPPPERSSPRHPPDGVPYRHSSEPSSAKHHTYHPSDSSVAQYSRHSLSQPSRPQSQQRPVAPASAPCVSSPPTHNSSSTGASNSSGTAAAAKEGRIHGSWTDHSSYMSNENHLPHGVSRVHKQSLPDDDGAEAGPGALLMLFRLSILIPIFSIAGSIYAIVGVFFVLLTSPLRLCSIIKASIRSRLCTLLAPALHTHERLVCLPRPKTARSSSMQGIYSNESYPYPSGEADPTDIYSACGLISVLLLSSFLSIALHLLTWVLACFWIFTMMLGNPDGTEKKDDGRVAVLGVMKWWQRWLGYARRSSA